MPKIKMWNMIRRYTWRFNNTQIVAKIKGRRGEWQAVIHDNEFNGKFNFEGRADRFNQAYGIIIDEMRNVTQKLKKSDKSE